VSEDSGEPGGEEQGGKGPLHRSFDLFVYAPVGAAVTLAEEIPELIEKGRQRVELTVSNARVVGRFVVHKGQRDLAGRIQEILHNGIEAARAGEAAQAAGDAGAPAAGARRERTGGAGSDAPVAPAAPAQPMPSTPPSPAPPGPAPDPVAAQTVQRALSDYDTLSASQVVRRLEGLGSDELRAVQRYEASHRNRRTILNRASQLLDPGAAESSAG
jgi:hypothetical protein